MKRGAPRVDMMMDAEDRRMAGRRSLARQGQYEFHFRTPGGSDKDPLGKR
jgi:hypothetical protein